MHAAATGSARSRSLVPGGNGGGFGIDHHQAPTSAQWKSSAIDCLTLCGPIHSLTPGKDCTCAACMQTGWTDRAKAVVCPRDARWGLAAWSGTQSISAAVILTSRRT